MIMAKPSSTYTNSNPIIYNQLNAFLQTFQYSFKIYIAHYYISDNAESAVNLSLISHLVLDYAALVVYK